MNILFKILYQNMWKIVIKYVLIPISVLIEKKMFYL